MLGVERFGASAPGGEMLENYGFTVDNVCKRAKILLGMQPAAEQAFQTPRQSP